MAARIAEDTRTVRIERRFDAPRELMFDASTQPEYLLQWYAPRGRLGEVVAVRKAVNA